MTANELAQLLFKRWNGDDVEIPPNLDDLCSEMLQKQQAKIEALQEHNVNLIDDLFAERRECLKLEKELALQKLSDIGQAIEQGELQALAKEFFEDYLDVQEESDSGRVFNPIHISCVRAMKVEPLAKLLIRMRELSGAIQAKACN